MKAILEFNLPEDAATHRIAVDAEKWCYIASEMDEWLRGRTKYPSDKQSPKATEALSLARQHLRDLMIENNLTFEP